MDDMLVPFGEAVEPAAGIKMACIADSGHHAAKTEGPNPYDSYPPSWLAPLLQAGAIPCPRNHSRAFATSRLAAAMVQGRQLAIFIRTAMG